MNTNAKVAIGFVGFVILIVLAFVAIAVAVPASSERPVGGSPGEGHPQFEVPFMADRGASIG